MTNLFSIRQLTVRMRQFLGHGPELRDDNREPAKNNILERGDFRIDLRMHKVSVCGHDLALSSEEFDMLVFMAGHPLRIITPRTLLSTRWGDHQIRQTDFLRVLTSLRKKIEAVEGCTNYIRTEPWIFYRFEPCR